MAEVPAYGSWSTGLCNCCSDNYGACCLTFWCPCVSFGRIAEIVDRGTSSCFVHGTLYCILGGFTQFGSLYACMYRTKFRRQYGIEGNQCTDCLLSLFCVPLSICQLYRELEARGFDVAAGWERNVQLRTRGAMEAPPLEGGMIR